MKLKKNEINEMLGKEDKYINTAVLIPIISINKKSNLLFQQRSLNIAQGNEICFPGGKFDKTKDKTFKETAIRETCEELGITKNKIKIKKKLGTIIAPIMGVIIDAYIGSIKINNINELKINMQEVSRVFCIPIEWFKKNKEKKYHVNIEIQPFNKKENGIKEYLFPAKEIGLPEKYEKPWSGKKHPVFVYQTKFGVIWGITAELIREYIKII